MDRVRIGVVGCGTISDIYLTNNQQKFSHVMEAYGCADSNMQSAEAKAGKYGSRPCQQMNCLTK